MLFLFFNLAFSIFFPFFLPLSFSLFNFITLAILLTIRPIFPSRRQHSIPYFYHLFTYLLIIILLTRILLSTLPTLFLHLSSLLILLSALLLTQQLFHLLLLPLKHTRQLSYFLTTSSNVLLVLRSRNRNTHSLGYLNLSIIIIEDDNYHW